MDRGKIIKQCKQNNRKAQRELYDHLSSMLFYTCKRYFKEEADIDDVLSESFVIIFTKLNQLKEEKALEGWAKRIAINQCLKRVKKNVNFNLYLENVTEQSEWSLPPDTSLEKEDLLQLLEYLPHGCKTIFNLFVIEGFSHKEIAEQLSISLGTSKSQLNVAKNKLKDLVNQYYFSKAN